MQPEQGLPPSPPPAAPKLDAERVALRAQPRPVTRLNRRMLAALAAMLSILVLLATLWSLRPATTAKTAAPDELYNVDQVARSEGLQRLPADYAALPAQVPQLGPPLPGDLGPAIVQAQAPVTATYDAPGQQAAGPELQRKASEDAAGSAVFFRTSQDHTAVAPMVPSPAATPASATVPDATPGPAALPQGAVQDPAMAQNGQLQKQAFADGTTGQAPSSGVMQGPVSPYQVMAGTLIAAALVTGIRSDLPGEVIATVTEPVFDTATGHSLLIPQGSRILGRYNSQVSFGQRRVQVVWDRIILPDTSSFTLDNLPGTDPAGYAGLEDGVDWHWGRIVAGAALTTMLGMAAELAAPQNDGDGSTVVVAGRDSLQDSVDQVGQDLSRRNLDLQPTLIERPGLPVRIIVKRDLVLRPYQPLFVGRNTP
ncbi:type IV secretion system protein VirB10 [Pseudoxanthomonas sp. GM95]|uniref:TrbI/VirB10 family protein n=1 Tax=Pseudoxanthomonas sp. GM95 TaxID=1881043 RepID=UPI0008CB4A59|nr:TrbI/VirB10 family protein [Pseudoxanthomonas sp. GM95]SEM59624.1 type IV secretion system protein VirB10 [Pseudoxanthomonas sp. GM95]